MDAQLAPVSRLPCARCGKPVGPRWVHASAIGVYSRVWTADFCGHCWPMVLDAIRQELDRGSAWGALGEGTPPRRPAPRHGRHRPKADP